MRILVQISAGNTLLNINENFQEYLGKWSLKEPFHKNIEITIDPSILKPGMLI